jgi:hypothetical protein
MNLPKHIVKFLEENFPAEKDLARLCHMHRKPRQDADRCPRL